jgi:uncharacterized protein
MKTRKIPLRMCLGCHEMKPKKELLRIVHNKDNEIIVDATGRKAGRGAYICRNAMCFEKARKGRKLEKAFETKINDEIYEILKQQLEENNDK